MTSQTLTVSSPKGEYTIQIGAGLSSALGATLRSLAPSGDCLPIVSDETVWSLHGETLRSSLGAAGFSPAVFLIPPGEESKSLSQLGALYNHFADIAADRDTPVVAFGGGVVGDLCGLAAATYMRGIPYIQMPTTLLAQADASVGGKTAVNLPRGKNLVGAFYFPKAVLADTDLLKTLPRREFQNGMAEIIKCAAISDASLFARLTAEAVEEARQGGSLAEIIAMSCSIKSDIVASDPFDQGRRMCLNFGHTFGHAWERAKLPTDRGALRHGEAVALGMVAAALLGEILGCTAGGTAARLRHCLENNGLDCSFRPLSPESIAWDKKRSAQSLSFVFLKEIGQAFVEKIPLAKLEAMFREVAETWPK